MKLLNNHTSYCNLILSIKSLAETLFEKKMNTSSESEITVQYIYLKVNRSVKAAVIGFYWSVGAADSATVISVLFSGSKKRYLSEMDLFCKCGSYFRRRRVTAIALHYF